MKPDILREVVTIPLSDLVSFFSILEIIGDHIEFNPDGEVKELDMPRHKVAELVSLMLDINRVSTNEED